MQKPNRSFAKKVFAAGLAVSTALWASAGLFVFVAQAVEAHPAGSLVLSSGTVWHISDDGAGRHGIDSAEKFYSHRFKFSDVVPANSADLALPDLGLLSWGSGVLFQDGGTVYQVSGGKKHGFTSAANFTGNGFKFSNAMKGSLAGVPEGAVIDSTTGAHLEGTFVLSGGTVWMITATGRKGIPSPAVLFSYGGKFEEIAAANSADLALADEGVASYRAGALVNDSGTVYAVTSTTKRGFPTGSCYTGFGFSFASLISGATSGLTSGANYCAGEGTPPPETGAGTLTVALASDTPAAGPVVENAARVGFTKVNFTASGGDVTIDSLTVERMGLSADSNFSSIVLLDLSGGTSVALASQIGNEKSFGSTHQAVFGDDIVVKNGTTKSILVAGNMAGTLTASETAKLALVEVKVAGSATVASSLPVTGNEMTMNGSTAIATVTVANGGQNPAATTQQVGTTDYIVSSLKITAGAQEDIEVHKIRFYQNGTASDSDVKDLELLVDSSVVGTVAKPVSKGADFVFNTPIVITKGNNKDFNLRLDIVDGSSRTISFDVDKQIDVVAKGKTYGFFRLPSYDRTASPYYDANNTTIDVGTITFSKGVLSSLNVAEGVKTQALGAFKATVQGEAVSVTRFVIGVSVTGTGNAQDVSNLVVKDSTGKVVAGPVDPDTGVTARDTATSTDTIIFPVGTSTYTVYGDLNTDFAGNDTILLDLPDPDGLTTAKGVTTNQTITANPTSGLNLDTVTVKAGGLTVTTSTNPAAQTVVIGKQDFVFANFVVDASTSGEDVRVTQFNVRHTTSDINKQTNISNLEFVVDGSPVSPIVQPTASGQTTATSTFSFSSPIVVTKGTSKTLSLRGDVNAGAANDTHAFGCLGGTCLTATGASTGTSITPVVTESSGQTMTLATGGTLTIANDASSPAAGMLVGGAEKQTVMVLNVSVSREEIDLTSIHFEPTAVNGGALNDEFSKVYLFEGGTQIASVTPTTTTAVTFESLPSNTFRIKPGQPKKLTVKVDVATIADPSNPSDATGDSGDGITFVVSEDAYGGTGIDSGTAITAANKSGSYTATAQTVYKSVPTLAQVSNTGTLVNTTGVVLYRFKVTADAKGDIGLYKFSFAVTTTTATVTQFEVYEEPGTVAQVNITANATRGVDGAPLVASSDGKNGQYGVRVLFDTGTDGVGNGGEHRTVSAGTSKTFEFRGTVSSSVSGSSVSTVMIADNAFTSTYPDCGGSASGADNACTGIAGVEQGEFVWSDLAYASASSTATNTAEWYNGFRVPGLTTTSSAQVISR